MTRLALTAILLASVAAPALAQGVAPSGTLHGQNWQMGQDLDNSRNPAAAPIGPAQDRARRAELQRRQNQTFSGTGRPVPGVPNPTPGPAATTPAPRPAALPARTTPPRRPLPEPATAAPSVRSAPVTLAPGQSTGAARGTPDSR